LSSQKKKKRKKERQKERKVRPKKKDKKEMMNQDTATWLKLCNTSTKHFQ